jgi:hypothetical protein
MRRTVTAHNMTVEQSPYDIYAEHNGDDNNVADYAASFTKTLEHDATTSYPTAGSGQPSYTQLLTALQTGLQADFNAIVRAGALKFVNPQGAFAYSLLGAPCSIIPMPSAPTLTSAHAAADMIETYLKAICRDVLLSDYGTGAGTDVDAFNSGSMTNNAAAVLTALGDAYKGPKDGSVVTAGVLFRGTTAGDLVGPYISQFWYLSTYPYFQSIEHVQQVPVAQNREFGIAWADFLDIQNGDVPQPYQGSDFIGQRYIVTTKDAGTIVHNDAPGEFFVNAVNILAVNGFPFAPNLPYNNGDITNEDAFVTMGIVDVTAALFVAMQEGLKHAWGHKWLGNRRLRPEAMAGLVHYAKSTSTNPLNLHSSLLTPQGGIDVLAWVKDRNENHADVGVLADAQTYVLPLVYPEGSPTHPSYPAGHAVIAGACSTIIKAFFDDLATIDSQVAPVKPDPMDASALVALSGGEGSALLTVGGELDKLASNIAIARNHAGVHYRADGDEGLLLGEQVALKILQDWVYTYNEQGFTGFELTLRNGDRVRVTAEGVTVLTVV